VHTVRLSSRVNGRFLTGDQLLCGFSGILPDVGVRGSCLLDTVSPPFFSAMSNRLSNSSSFRSLNVVFFTTLVRAGFPSMETLFAGVLLTAGALVLLFESWRGGVLQVVAVMLEGAVGVAFSEVVVVLIAEEGLAVEIVFAIFVGVLYTADSLRFTLRLVKNDAFISGLGFAASVEGSEEENEAFISIFRGRESEAFRSCLGLEVTGLWQNEESKYENLRLLTG